MPLASDFQFSQSSLQDYVSCPRRFELRYILRLSYPAPMSEPVLEYELQTERGRLFHQLVHQHTIGLPADILGSLELDPELSTWWQNYLNSSPVNQLPPMRYSEHMLSAALSGWRVTARYDLLAIAPHQKAIIIDWKTASSRPVLEILRKRIQSRLYPLLLVEAGKSVNEGEPLDPDQIEMFYWYPAYPTQLCHFQYNHLQYEQDRNFILSLITEIADTRDQTFSLTMNEKLCKFCTYRSLCNRGARAGDMDDLESLDDMEDITAPDNPLDFNQLPEIQF